jgi:hypothetical protein
MIGYIYSNESNEIVCEIHGIDNDDVEAMADDLNFMGGDLYSLSYTRGQMAFATGHDYQVTDQHAASYD